MNLSATLRALLAIALTLHGSVMAALLMDAPAQAATFPAMPAPSQPQGPATPVLHSTLRDGLLVDGNNNGAVNPGDTLRYTATLSSTAVAHALYFTATLDVNTLLAGSVARISPLARPEQYTAQQNQLLTIGASGVLGNDTGWPQPAVATGSITTTAGGLVTMTATGAFSYMPPADYIGTDSFIYIINNALGTDSAVVDLDVQAPPEPNSLGRANPRPGGAKSMAAPAARTVIAPRAQGKEGSAEEIYATIGDLAAGKLVTITFDAIVGDPLPADVQSLATQGSAGAANAATVLTDDPDSTDAFDPTRTALDVHANLALSKHVNVAGALPGQRITYTLAYTNTGPDTALSAILTDVIPASFASAVWSSDRSISELGDTPFAWQLGNLAAGESGLLRVSVVVIPAVRSIVVNTATISSGTPDDDSADNTASIEFELQNATPLVKDDVVTTTEGISVTVLPLSNDSDYNNDALSLVAVGTPSTGTVLFTPPSLTYVPAPLDAGTRVFTYSVSDGGITATARITVNVLPVNNAPLAMASGSQTATVYSPVTLDGSNSSDVDGPLPLRYLWQQVAGPAVGFDPMLSTTTFVAPGAPGTLIFTLIVTDGAGLPSAAVTTTVIVIDSVAPELNLNSAAPTTLGAATHFTASTASSNALFVWDMGDGAVLTQTGASGPAGSQSTLTHVYAAIGSYTVTVTATNSISASTASLQVTVRDLAPTDLRITSNAPGTLDQNTAFTATAGGTNLNFAWHFGDGSGATGGNVSHRYAAPGVYTAVVTASNSSGAISGAITVTIQPAPRAPNRVFLPFLAQPAAGTPLPDLLIERISLANNVPAVVIKNAGTAPVTGAFWVDLYVNPTPAPQRVNEVWYDNRSARGAVWGVDGAAVLPLAPGQALTLTLNSPLLNAALTYLPGLSAGDTLYVQVDSASTADPVNGAVREAHEAAGAAYNNITSVQVTQSIALSPVMRLYRALATQFGPLRLIGDTQP